MYKPPIQTPNNCCPPCPPPCLPPCPPPCPPPCLPPCPPIQPAEGLSRIVPSVVDDCYSYYQGLERLQYELDLLRCNIQSTVDCLVENKFNQLTYAGGYPANQNLIMNPEFTVDTLNLKYSLATERINKNNAICDFWFGQTNSSYAYNNRALSVGGTNPTLKHAGFYLAPYINYTLTFSCDIIGATNSTVQIQIGDYVGTFDINNVNQRYAVTLQFTQNNNQNIIFSSQLPFTVSRIKLECGALATPFTPQTNGVYSQQCADYQKTFGMYYGYLAPGLPVLYDISRSETVFFETIMTMPQMLPNLKPILYFSNSTWNCHGDMVWVQKSPMNAGLSSFTEDIEMVNNYVTYAGGGVYTCRIDYRFLDTKYNLPILDTNTEKIPVWISQISWGSNPIPYATVIPDI